MNRAICIRSFKRPCDEGGPIDCNTGGKLRGQGGRCSGGLTLIESLTAIGVVAILFALLLPAVSAVRESSRRVQCANNLRQIGVALKEYHASWGYFPSASMPTFSTPRGLGGESRLSPQLQLLPWLGIEIDNVPLSGDPTFEELRPVGQPVSVYICPSDVPARGRETNYRVALGPGPYDWLRGSRWSRRQGGMGAFVILTFLRETDFPKGLSKVAGVSEKLRGDLSGKRISIDSDLFESGLVDTVPNPEADELVEYCSKLSPASVAHISDSGVDFRMNGYRYTWYNHVLPPNSRIPDYRARFSGNNNTPGGLITARANHGGVHVLTMAGEVQFVAPEIDVDVWRTFGNRLVDSPF